MSRLERNCYKLQVEQEVDTLCIWLKIKTPRKSQKVSEEDILEIEVKKQTMRQNVKPLHKAGNELAKKLKT